MKNFPLNNGCQAKVSYNSFLSESSGFKVPKKILDWLGQAHFVETYLLGELSR